MKKTILQSINLNFFPTFIYDQKDIIIDENNHPKLRLLQLFTSGNEVIKSKRLCDYNYGNAETDSEILFNKICGYLVSGNYPDSSGLKTNWFKIQASYLGVLLAIENGDYNIDHSSPVLLLKNGKYVDKISHRDDIKKSIKIISKLL